MASSSDPANVGYIIQENGFWYVAYKEKVKVPEVVVSAKGVVNGLSEEYNDGYDFGPDSYSPTSTSAIPYTQTVGWQEALTYLEPTGGKIMYIGDEIAVINVPLTYNSSKPLIIEGVRGANSSNYVIGPALQPSSSFPSGSFLLNVTTPAGNTGSLTIRDFALYGNVGTGTTQVAGGIQGNPNGSTTYAIPQITIENCKFVYFTDAMYFDQEGSGPINITDSQFTYCDHGIHLTGSSGGTNHYVNIETYLTNIPIYIDDGATQSVNISNFAFLGALAFAYVGDGAIQMENGFGDVISSSALYGFGSGSGTPGLSFANCSFTLSSSVPAGIGMFAFVDSAPSGAHWHITGANTTYTFVGNSGTAYSLFAYSGANTPAFDAYDIGGELILQDSATVTIGYTAFGTFYIKKIHYSYITSVGISANPPASGTVYQNTNPYDIEIDLPVYATTAGTAGYVTVAKGATSTPSTVP